MKYLPLFLLLVFSIVSSSVSAQIDSLTGVAYPFKKEILVIGDRLGVDVSLLRITSSNGNEKKLCRISTSDWSLTTASKGNYNTTLDKDELEGLIATLSKWFVLAGESTPPIYTEYVDLIKDNNTHLEMSMFIAAGKNNWNIILDADHFLNRGRAEISMKELPKIVEDLKTCLEML